MLILLETCSAGNVVSEAELERGREKARERNETWVLTKICSGLFLIG